MNVADVMTKKPVTIRNSDTLARALELMETHNCRHLPVVSAEDHLIGIVSDRDCRLALNSPYLLHHRSWDEEVVNHTLVATIMSPAPIVVEPNMPAGEAARLMLANQISALPVMQSETLVGIVTTSDILMAFMRVMGISTSK